MEKDVKVIIVFKMTDGSEASINTTLHLQGDKVAGRLRTTVARSKLKTLFEDVVDERLNRDTHLLSVDPIGDGDIKYINMGQVISTYTYIDDRHVEVIDV